VKNIIIINFIFNSLIFMSDKEFLFEERKINDRNLHRDLDQNQNEKQGQEYYKGGGGGSGNGFFSIKTNVYSKQCYSDPENPGKMICKETKNSSGYDPFNKENNFKKTKENVYTHDSFDRNFGNSGGSNYNNYNDSEDNINFQQNEEPSIFDKMYE
jgi:hypothetical protein